MDYRIEAETKHRIRIRIGIRKLSEEQAKILKYAFSHAPGVSEVTVYKASAGCAIAYTGDRSEIIRRLNSFNFDNVQMMAEKEEENARISAEEMKKRKLEASFAITYSFEETGRPLRRAEQLPFPNISNHSTNLRRKQQQIQSCLSLCSLLTMLIRW